MEKKILVHKKKKVFFLNRNKKFFPNHEKLTLDAGINIKAVQLPLVDLKRHLMSSSPPVNSYKILPLPLHSNTSTFYIFKYHGSSKFSHFFSKKSFHFFKKSFHTFLSKTVFTFLLESTN